MMRCAALMLAISLSSCVAPAQSRFPPDVAQSLREQPMRRLETQSLILYYPAPRKEVAMRVAARIEGCTEELVRQARIRNDHANRKMVLVLPDVPFNNAFVIPPLAGYEPISVIPTGNTLDFATELGVPPDPSYVGCHEIVHYVHMLQIDGSWGFFNTLFGEVISPQIGLDPWFGEGIATYYESKLQPGTGRMAWPAWRGMFHAAYAGEGVSGGDFSALHRPFHWGNHYLVGSHFIEFVAERYGEDTLWKLIDDQGGSCFFPLFVALRWDVTGKTLPSLIDEFSDYVKAQYPVRPRPAEQTTVRGAGTAARYAVAPTGREAIISMSGDQPTRLRIYDGDRMIRERSLTEIVPPRTLAVAQPIMTSGLSFTADGRSLYFVAIDLGQVIQEARLLRYDVDADELEVVLPRIGGPGGSVSPDGSTYYYAYADGDRHHLAALDLATKTSRMVREAGARGYYGPARPSPDGTRLVAAVFDGQSYVIRVLDARTGKTVKQLAPGGAVHDPVFAGDQRVVLLAEHQGRFQVHLWDLGDGSLVRVTDAPYLAFQPRPRSGAVRFLDRQGWRWNVDEVPLRALPEREAPAAGEPLPDLPYAGPGGAAHADAPGLAEAAPARAEPRVVSDEPYSQLDHFFYPSLRTPLFLAPQDDVALTGLSLAGGDRLSFHRWSIFGAYDWNGEEVSGGFEYATALLAPWDVKLQAQQIAYEDPGDEEIGEPDRFRRERSASLTLGRTFRTTRVDLSAEAIEDYDPDFPLPVLQERRLIGPRLDLSYTATEATPYGGARRALVLAGSAAYFDDELSTLPARFADVAAGLAVALPFPLGPRHRISLGLRGRRLWGLDRDTGFLEVGGTGAAFVNVWDETDGPDAPDPDVDLLGSPIAFQEPLRGFEDRPFLTDRIAIGELVWHYPVILDYGWASTAYLLPSWFFRQLDLELFASGATDSFVALEDRHHLAAGASAGLSMAIWIVPVSVRYQLARRFTDDESYAHSVAIGTVF